MIGRRDLRAALAPWIVAHVLVVISMVAGRFIVDHVSRGNNPGQSRNGLFAWDGGWYRDIAQHWYPAMPRTAVRFYPLYPAVGRGLGWLLSGAYGAVLVVVASVAALLAAALFHRLLIVDGHGAVAARHGVWMFTLFPAAGVLVLAYAEALFMVLSIGCVLALRRQHWLTAAGLGCAAATCRPFGLLLVLAALIEVARHRQWSWRPVLAVVAPALGTGAVALLAHDVTGSWTAPLHEQNVLRGDFVDPVTRTLRAVGDLLGHERLDGLHAPFVVAFIVLLVIASRRLPLSYSLYAGACVALALSAENLNSFERYGLNAFPLVIVLTLLTARSAVGRRLAVVGSGAGFVALATLAFAGRYVP